MASINSPWGGSGTVVLEDPAPPGVGPSAWGGTGSITLTAPGSTGPSAWGGGTSVQLRNPHMPILVNTWDGPRYARIKTWDGEQMR